MERLQFVYKLNEFALCGGNALGNILMWNTFRLGKFSYLHPSCIECKPALLGFC